MYSEKYLVKGDAIYDQRNGAYLGHMRLEHNEVLGHKMKFYINDDVEPEDGYILKDVSREIQMWIDHDGIVTGAMAVEMIIQGADVMVQGMDSLNRDKDDDDYVGIMHDDFMWDDDVEKHLKDFELGECDWYNPVADLDEYMQLKTRER